MIVDRITCLFAVAAFLIAPGICRTQESSVAFSDSSLEHTVEAGEASVAAPKRHLVHWNEFDGPFFTLRLGAGLLYDAAVYSQDERANSSLTWKQAGRSGIFVFSSKGGSNSSGP
jgi:hypothetical protein